MQLPRVAKEDEICYTDKRDMLGQLCSTDCAAKEDYMKKTISIVTAAAIFCCMPFPVLHGHALSGTGGPNVTWTYENGKLTLSGSGSTMDLAERFYLEVDASFHILNDPWEDFRGEIREIVVEDGITDIGQMLFADTVSLETITLPDSVTVFDSYAFFHTGILRVNFPKHLKYIGNDCFRESKLRFAELPDGLEAIGANCYAGCQQLIAVTMQDSVKRIGKAAFSSCPTFSRIRLSQTLTELPDNCFYGCERLKEVTMPEACTTLGKNCFAGCASMQMLRLPPGIRTIGSRAFGQCFALQQLDLPDGLTTISEDMLSECKSIQSLTVPESVTCIERGAFERCQFETLRLPSHRQLAIAEDALPEAWLNRQTGFVILGDGMLFHYGGNDAEVTLPDSVKTLMPNFLGQSEVRKLTLGQHTAEIRNDAFASNTLETVVIPSENVKFDPKAADGAKKLTTFFGKRYSPVHSFAVQNGYRFTATDAEQPHHNTQEIYGSMNLPFGNSGEVFGDCIRNDPHGYLPKAGQLERLLLRIIRCDDSGACGGSAGFRSGSGRPHAQRGAPDRTGSPRHQLLLSDAMSAEYHAQGRRRFRSDAV